MSSTDYLLSMVKAQKTGRAAGVCSICSANRFVVRAAMMQASADDVPVLIESTSNQVNQFGGYTGMTAEQFRNYVHGIASELRFPVERIILGGDHLGPNAWQKEPAASAMQKSLELVRSCVRAGYSKIHLDASMRCADDPGDKHTPLNERAITRRAAEMAAAAEQAWAELPKGAPAPLYVIGTEVPVPGGEQADHNAVAITTAADARRTIELTKAAFDELHLASAWPRVIATVVQPGVEFGDDTVIAYDRAKAGALARTIEGIDGLVYEAHSTDYQTRQALRQLVEDHFAILKVGPWLTFALREAVFALAEIETQWLSGKPGATLSQAPAALESVMLANPGYWRSYYQGDDNQLRLARKFSYSDRCRYYWPQPALEAALNRLIANLRDRPAPLTMVSQYLPNQYQAIRSGRLQNEPVALIQDKIMEVTACYSSACLARN